MSSWAVIIEIRASLRLSTNDAAAMLPRETSIMTSVSRRERAIVPLAARVISEPVHVLYTVACVGTVLPHAEERKILDGLALDRWVLLNREMHLNDGLLFDLDGFERLENAVFVLGWNGHRGSYLERPYKQV